MLEKFAEDVNRRYQEKLADILSKRMDMEDWLTGSLEERNRYADSLGEGNYQLFNLGGKPYPAIGQGNESIVYPAIGSTRNGRFSMNSKGLADYNFVAKSPKTYRNNEFIKALMEADIELSQQLNRKKDIQLNPKNIWLPFNDFEGGKNKGITLSQRLTEAADTTDVNVAVRDLNRELRESNPSGKITNANHIKARLNMIGIPEIYGQSGNVYTLSDFGVQKGKNGKPVFKNMMFDNMKRLKVMDYIAKMSRGLK
ncbi:MAG: hypothetical protein J6Y02_08140 [Pseudobutyrivibrio sp.]|nr:hypothetical protein [Pseudobutyrivibrio sp.]